MTHVFAGERAERSLPDLLDIIRKWHPDILVRESTEFAGFVAAERTGIPHASILIVVPPTGFLQVMDAPLRHLFALVGLSPKKPADMLDRHLLLSSRPQSLWNPEVPVPSSMHVFRYTSFNQSGAEELPSWVAELRSPKERPTVYATLGTVFNYRTDILLAILAGLRDERINLVLTVGRDRHPFEFGEQPPHVLIEQYIPQDLLFPHCDLVITHGGSGTIMDSLSIGLPMVIIPIGADQSENAQRCLEAGVARVVTLKEDARLAQAIRDAVWEVLQDPQYRENARQLRKEIEELPGLEYPVSLLERLAIERAPLIESFETSHEVVPTDKGTA